MLGMMNCPSDSVEFYCQQPADSKIARDLPEEAALFADKEKNKKASITYTKDGRKMIDGVLVEEGTAAPNLMWNGLFARTITKQIADGEDGKEEGGEHQKEGKQEPKPMVEIVQPTNFGQAKNSQPSPSKKEE